MIGEGNLETLINIFMKEYVSLDSHMSIFWISVHFVIGILFYLATFKGVTLIRATRLTWQNSFKPSKSFAQDAKIFIIKLVLSDIVIFSILGLYISEYDIRTYLVQALGVEFPVTYQKSVTIDVLFTVSFFLVYDFSTFLYHFAGHKIPALWALHKMHHTATSLNLLTAKRIHVIEDLNYYMFKGVFLSLLYIGFLKLGYRPSQVLLFGFFPLIFGFFLCLSNFRHSEIPVYWSRPWSYVFLSPAHHQIHHSLRKEHMGKNAGLFLSVYDRLVGNYVEPVDLDKVKYGISEESPDGGIGDNLWRIYFLDTPREYIRSIFTKGVKQKGSHDGDFNIG